MSIKVDKSHFNSLKQNNDNKIHICDYFVIGVTLREKCIHL